MRVRLPTHSLNHQIARWFAGGDARGPAGLSRQDRIRRGVRRWYAGITHAQHVWERRRGFGGCPRGWWRRIWGDVERAIDRLASETQGASDPGRNGARMAALLAQLGRVPERTDAFDPFECDEGGLPK